jgi:hypothetical protein
VVFVGKKKREDDINDRLERENRELKSLNRQLLRRLKKVDRQFRASQELEDETDEPVKQKEYDCPKCRKADLTELTFGKVTFVVCEAACGYREKKK